MQCDFASLDMREGLKVLKNEPLTTGSHTILINLDLHFDAGQVYSIAESFAYRNLYVADGSIMPAPVGHNPSKTIAALSERIAEAIVSEGR